LMSMLRTKRPVLDITRGMLNGDKSGAKVDGINIVIKE
jgi:hypothetical protein